MRSLRFRLNEDTLGASGPQFIVRADAGVGVVSVDFEGRVTDLNGHNNHVAINGLTFRATR